MAKQRRTIAIGIVMAILPSLGTPVWLAALDPEIIDAESILCTAASFDPELC